MQGDACDAWARRRGAGGPLARCSARCPREVRLPRGQVYIFYNIVIFPINGRSHRCTNRMCPCSVGWRPGVGRGCSVEQVVPEYYCEGRPGPSHYPPRRQPCCPGPVFGPEHNHTNAGQKAAAAKTGLEEGRVSVPAVAWLTRQ